MKKNNSSLTNRIRIFITGVDGSSISSLFGLATGSFAFPLSDSDELTDEEFRPKNSINSGLEYITNIPIRDEQDN